MAYSYTNSNITFNGLITTGKKPLNYKPQYSGNDFAHANEDGVIPFINAVEIDWNGAQLGNN